MRHHFEEIYNYLVSQDCKFFADDLRSRLDKDHLLDRLTLILAPTNQAIVNFARQFNLTLASLDSDPRVDEVLDNHLSILPIGERYPVMTAINGTYYGFKMEDFVELGAVSNVVIGGIRVIIIRKLIVTPEQRDRLSRSITDLDPDVFHKMIATGNIRGASLLSLCGSSPQLSYMCDFNQQLIFRQLLSREFQVEYLAGLTRTPREIYLDCIRAWRDFQSLQIKIEELDEILLSHRDRLAADGYVINAHSLESRNDIFDLLYNPRSVVMLTDADAVRGPNWENRPYNKYDLSGVELEQMWFFLTFLNSGPAEALHANLAAFRNAPRSLILSMYINGNFPMPILQFVLQIKYQGWIMIEDEQAYRAKFVNFPVAFTEWRFAMGDPDIAEQIVTTEERYLPLLENYEDVNVYDIQFNDIDIQLLQEIHQAVVAGRLTVFDNYSQRMIGKMQTY
jgi:hypothetical protein